MTSKPKAELSPFIKVLSGANGSTDSLLGADGPILLKGCRSNDRRLVHTGTSEYFVGSLIDGEVALGSPRLIREKISMSIHDVIFD